MHVIKSCVLNVSKNLPLFDFKTLKNYSASTTSFLIILLLTRFLLSSDPLLTILLLTRLLLSSDPLLRSLLTSFPSLASLLIPCLKTPLGPDTFSHYSYYFPASSVKKEGTAAACEGTAAAA